MASLTPLSKGLIALAVIGGMASAVWHLGLKEKVGGDAASFLASLTTLKPAAEVSAPAVPTTIAPPVQMAPAVVQAETPAPPPPASSTPSTPPSPQKVEAPAPASTLSPAEVSENAEAGRKAMAAGDFAKARKHLELAVQSGDGAAACLLGEMTLKGQGGIAADQEKAASLFQLAQSRSIICFASGQ
jgi:hypothetical protein